jgi:hypothetical protein
VTSTNMLVSVLVWSPAMINFFIEAMINLTYVILYSARWLMLSIVNLKVTNTDDFTWLQAVLIIHIPARLRNFNIKDSSCFVNAINSLFGIKLFHSNSHLIAAAMA